MGHRIQTRKVVLFATFIILSFAFSACAFQKGVRHMNKEEYEKAITDFDKAVRHKTYGLGAQYRRAQAKLHLDFSLQNLIQTNQVYCDLETNSRELSIQVKRKLKRYNISTGEINKSREHLQQEIRKRLFSGASISDLLLLDANNGCWPESALDSIRRVVVNKNLDSSEPVFDPPLEYEWKDPALKFPSEATLDTAKGYSCDSYLKDNPWELSYRDAVSIQETYSKYILSNNYSTWWRIKDYIWSIFQLHESYCQMDNFATEFPNYPLVSDCWYEAASTALCSDDLEELLDFHQNHPHTALDWEVCEKVVCLQIKRPESKSDRWQQIQDINDMVDIYSAIYRDCFEGRKMRTLVKTIGGFARSYPHHRVPFDLAVEAVDLFLCKDSIGLALEAINYWQPLFPDTVSCDPGFYFQSGKQAWFDSHRKKLDSQLQLSSERPQKVFAWSTPDHDEYDLVSYGPTKEVFFMRKELSTGKVQVMQSIYNNRKKIWSPAKAIESLYISNDMHLLSIGQGGRKLLLSSEGQLWQAYREKINRQWYAPRKIDLGGHIVNFGWMSPDDSLLYISVYEDKPLAGFEPTTDLAVAKLGVNEKYYQATPLKSGVNVSNSNEQRPVVALGGRMLFFISDRRGKQMPFFIPDREGFGDMDMYSINYLQAGNWDSGDQVKNLGAAVNTLNDDYGITYFSEYAGLAYFHEKQCCEESLDIWQVKLGPEIFPKALRLAGLVLDENGHPLSGGFMEFTPNYQLNVHSQPLSNDGTYVYTVPDTTAVVRLFPEVPGYYSEKDATKYLEEIEPGEIIRDTFVLTSFEHIRKHFKLENSTFYKGTAEFDHPNLVYPEITRLAKIANRMGADLELTGHTDDARGSIDNVTLSLQRAESVKRFLIDKCGFDPSRIHTYGKGDSEPVAPNTTEEGRRLNRRIDIVFLMPELDKN